MDEASRVKVGYQAVQTTERANKQDVYYSASISHMAALAHGRIKSSKATLGELLIWGAWKVTLQRGKVRTYSWAWKWLCRAWGERSQLSFVGSEIIEKITYFYHFIMWPNHELVVSLWPWVESVVWWKDSQPMKDSQTMKELMRYSLIKALGGEHAQ